MGARSKQAKKIRTASEFDLRRLTQLLNQPRDGRADVFSWTLEEIFAARNAQLRGDFMRPAQMADAMLTDDAIHVAYENRLAPQRCLRVRIKPSRGTRAEGIASEADALYGNEGIGATPETFASINGCLAQHGLAIGFNVAAPREDGSRIDYHHHFWPMRYVRHDPITRQLMARVDTSTLPEGEIAAGAPRGSGYEVPIVHGDGRWVVYAKHAHEPWKQEAAILAAAMVWARHGFGGRSWTKAADAHGNAKMVGKMPPGVVHQNSDGSLTKEAEAFIELMIKLATGDGLAGIAPAGSELSFLANASSAWQVFSELVLNAEKSAARIYTGTDGFLGAQSGAPGVDISVLFGVATTRVQGDIACIERAFKTGVIEPWTAINFGDSTLAPTRSYEMPDADEDARSASLAKRQESFHAEIARRKTNGFVVNQEDVDELAASFNVKAPTLVAATQGGT